VLIAAHADGLGLMVRSIEEDGFLGFVTVGGFDPRVLLGLEVVVHGREGDYFGVIGAKPPHVLSDEDRKKVLTVPELFIDIGFPREKTERLVSVGDIVSFQADLKQLAGSVITGRALDDRAGIAVMLEAMRLLRKTPCQASAVFCATTREEVCGYGAATSAYALRPDFAVIIDVTHAKFKGSDDPRMVPFDQCNVGSGPMMDRRLRARMEAVARKAKIPLAFDFMPGHTSTDGDEVIASRAGVPLLLLQLPLRYMHTTVETLDGDLVRRTGKLLALFLREVTAEWEGWTCTSEN
jgi:endoglucanase